MGHSPSQVGLTNSVSPAPGARHPAFFLTRQKYVSSSCHEELSELRQLVENSWTRGFSDLRTLVLERDCKAPRRIASSQNCGKLPLPPRLGVAGSRPRAGLEGATLVERPCFGFV